MERIDGCSQRSGGFPAPSGKYHRTLTLHLLYRRRPACPAERATTARPQNR
ncbi:hypothetical protein [Pontiella desulfatans]|uniref:hypothetical protein n=1 Tax=Pontiella desulfatans TaxID=2750659 RepID=UPI0014444167|nr:hypothetical protein [Pontiella desulfatans]